MDRDGLVEDILTQDAKLVAATATGGIVTVEFGPVSAVAVGDGDRWLEVRLNRSVLSRVRLSYAHQSGLDIYDNVAGSPMKYFPSRRRKLFEE